MDTKKVQELEEKLAAIQREIEALKAQPVEEEIPKGTIVKVWDEDEKARVAAYEGASGNPKLPHEADGCCWEHATPHPNYMMWRKHDGGPQPVGDDVWVVVIHRDGERFICQARHQDWRHMSEADIIAFAVLTTPELP